MEGGGGGGGGGGGVRKDVTTRGGSKVSAIIMSKAFFRVEQWSGGR